MMGPVPAFEHALTQPTADRLGQVQEAQAAA